MEFTTPEIHIPPFNLFIPTWDTSPVAFWIMCGIGYFIMWAFTARLYEKWAQPNHNDGDTPGVATGILWPIVLPVLLVIKFSVRT